jgi:hypothetical protein
VFPDADIDNETRKRAFRLGVNLDENAGLNPHNTSREHTPRGGTESISPAGDNNRLRPGQQGDVMSLLTLLPARDIDLGADTNGPERW